MKSFLSLFLLDTIVADFVLRYNDAQGILRPPYIPLSVGGDKRPAKFLLDLESADSFVFGKACRKPMSCSINEHKYVYSPRTEKSGPFGVVMNGGTFTGDLHEDSLKIGNLNIPLSLGVINNGSRAANVNWDGVLGLRPDGGDGSSTVSKIMRNLSAKQIIIQEGVHPVQRKDKQMPTRSMGAVTFGIYQDNQTCGIFNRVNTADNINWNIIANVKIGNQLLRLQRIAFLPGRSTEIPHPFLGKYFKEGGDESDQDYPSISFGVGSVSYTITKEDYASYNVGDQKYRPFLNSARGKDYDFGFGSDFLQHYCLILLNYRGTLQVGLAENNGASQKKN